MQEHQRLQGKPLYASSAQLTVQHTKEEVNGKTLLTVANFPRKQIGPRMSDCLITGVQVNSSDEATRKASTVMVQCSHAVQPGMLITVTGSAQASMSPPAYISSAFKYTTQVLPYKFAAWSPVLHFRGVKGRLNDLPHGVHSLPLVFTCQLNNK